MRDKVAAGRLPLLATLLGAALLVAPAAAQVKITEVIDLRAVFPMGGRQGTAVRVRLFGKHIDEVSQVLVSDPGIRVRAVSPAGSSEARAELVIAPDAAPGLRLIRVIGRYGISDPVPFVVGGLPELLEKEPNDSGSAAQPVAVPVVLNGQLNPAEDVDCFRFRARAGETVVLAVESYTLDGSPSYGEGKGRRWVDATLTVYDTAGRVLARNEDFHSPDPLIDFRPERDGEYIAEVRDLGYQGAPAAAYRLTAGAVPWATSIYPAGGRRGEKVQVELRGFNLEGRARAEVDLREAAGDVVAAAPLADLANTRPFVVGDLSEARETEPNDERAQANPIESGSTVNGCLQPAGDVDAFRLSLKKDAAVEVSIVASGTLRSPVDVTLSVADGTGKVLARNDDAGLQFAPEDTDPSLVFNPPADGDYLLQLQDVAGRGDGDSVYRLTVKPAGLRLDLTTFWDNVSIRGKGGSGAFLAVVDRRGYAGPVRVRIRGLPPGFAGSEGTIFPGHDSVLLTITADPATPLGAVARFSLEGEAQVNGRPVAVRNRPNAQRDQDGETLWRPSDGCIAAVVPAPEFQLRTAVREVTGAPGDTLHIPVVADRAPGYTAAFQLRSVQCKFNLGSTPERFRSVVTVAEAVREVDFTLPLPADLAPGDYTFAICRAMGHDFRIDRPYPSTHLIHLVVKK